MKIKKIIASVACVCLLSIFLAIPAFAVVTESSGDGYALYNGYKLPDITPYLHMGSYTDDIAIIYKLDVSAYADGELFYLEAYSLSQASIRLYCATTPEVVSVAAQMGLPLEGVYVWTNPDDIELPSFISGSVIWATRAMLEAAAGSLGISVYVPPISLDGYNLVEWDGDTSGLTVSGDTVLLFNKYLDATSAFTVMDLSYSQYPVVIDDFIPTHTSTVDSWRVAGPSSGYIMSALSHTADDGTAMTAVLKFDDIDDTGYTKMIAYRTVESPPSEGGGEDDDPHPPFGG